MAAEDFAVFYERTYPGAKRLAHLLSNGSPVADDVVQDAFTRLHRVQADPGDVDNPEVFLRAAVVAGCLHPVRRRRVQPSAGSVAGPGPVEIPDPLLDAVAEVPLRARAALVLRYWAQLPDVEIGDALGVGPAMAQSLIRRGLGDLDDAGDPGDRVLERDLGDALAVEARSVVLRDPEWRGPRPAIAAPGRWRRSLLAVAALAAVAIALVITLRPPAPDGVLVADQGPSPAAFETGGQRRISPARLLWAPSPYVVGPIRPGSFRAYQRGDEQFVTYETIETRPGATVVEVWCVEALRRPAACFPTEYPLRPEQFSRILIWLDLPPGTVSVAYRSAGEVQWQRAINGTVAFVGSGDPDAELVAVDAEGQELERLEDRAIVAIGTVLSGDAVVYDSLDAAGNRAVATAATAGALQCLGAAGFDSDFRRPTPSGVEVDAVWRGCVRSARAAAASTFARLDGRVVESEADDPSIVGLGQ
jgi:DNA-directed RNA polymerase specialized sigma24 family protein